MAVARALGPGRQIARRAASSRPSSSTSTASPDSITRNSSSPSCQWRWVDHAPGFSDDMAGAEIGEAGGGREPAIPAPRDLARRTAADSRSGSSARSPRGRPWASPVPLLRRCHVGRPHRACATADRLPERDSRQRRGVRRARGGAGSRSVSPSIASSLGEPPDGPIENLFAIRGEGGPHFGFAGHLDVVPPGEGWSSDPFAPVIEAAF